MNSGSRLLRPIAALLTGLAVMMSVQAQGAATDLEKCDKPMGAVAVVEPQDYAMGALARYNLQSPVGLMRMMIQQSNCFIVVERGQGMQNMMQERALAGGGAGGGWVKKILVTK